MLLFDGPGTSVQYRLFSKEEGKIFNFIGSFSQDKNIRLNRCIIDGLLVKINNINMYRIKDPLDNLVLRVRLRKVNVIRKLDTPRNQDIEELTFRWQEKYFNILEKERYRDRRDDDIITPLHNQYSSLLLKEERNNNIRLFTYTAQDHYQPINVEEKQVKKKGRSRQTMYIMADLQTVENGPDFDEKLLLSITVDSEGLMTLSHDLSHDNKWYRIESTKREIFEYQLFNDSRPISSQELKREKELHAKLQGHQRERLLQSIGDNFEPLPEDKSSRYIHVLGTIETAEGFGDTPLYVTLRLCPLNQRYQLQYGSEVISTQLCSPNAHHEAIFNCPFEYRLLYTEATPTETTPIMTTPPFIELSFEVSSLDYWDRHRMEGRGMCHLPISLPGTRTININTCRPRPSTLMDELTRYFIGSPSLYNEREERGGGEGERGVMSKFGAQTISSGKVTIKASVIHHSHECADKFTAKELNETLRNEPKLYSLMKASDVYRRARSKALQLLATQS